MTQHQAHKRLLRNTHCIISSHLTMGIWLSLDKSNKKLCYNEDEYILLG